MTARDEPHPAPPDDQAGPGDGASQGALDAADEPLELRTARGRWVLAATVGASSMAFLDGTVVNVALPEIGRGLDTDLAGLQWVLNGYLLATASLILLGGSLGDIFGRRAVFLIGIVVFAAASVACGLAGNVQLLVLARVAQGVGGALLTPASLAILEASFRRQDRSRAIGAWSGLSGVAGAVGPFLGGWLVDAGSWRLIFLLNLPLALAVALVALRHVPESRDPGATRHVDVMGAVIIAASLAAISWALIAAGERGWGAAPVVVALGGGLAGLVLFVVAELRSRHPMVPPEIFAIAQFRAANLVTVAVYAGLGVVFFLLVVQLQQVLGYSALEAGAATLPITLLMLSLSSMSGQLAERIGPRLQMSAGPVVIAAGLALMATIDAGDRYLTGVLPAVLVVGLGLSATVAPLTATALGAVDDRHAGVASGVNTTVARASQLAAVAAVPVVAGISGDSYRDPAAFSDGFAEGMLIAAALVAVGGLIGLLTVRNAVHAGAAAELDAESVAEPAVEPEEAPEAAARPVPVGAAPGPEVAGEPASTRFHCGIGGPALTRCPRSPSSPSTRPPGDPTRDAA